MSRASQCLTVVGFVAAISCAGLAQAQFGSEAGVVSGSGVVVISRKPETVRVQIVLQGKGTTLKDALAAIKTRGEAAKKQLLTLGAAKDSVKLEDAKIAEQDDNRQQQQRRMQMMMMQRGRAPKAAKKGPKTPDPVLVSATITAEWKLEAKSADELLLAVHGLKEKIKGSDVAGVKEAEKLSPEEEEALEEMQAEDFGSYNQNEGPKPGEPVFLFVTHISDAEREKAFGEAYQKAKTEAARVAKAAGAELGELKSLSGNSASGNDNQGYANYNSRAYRAYQMARMAAGNSDDENSTEAIGGDPGQVKFNVTVMAAFDLKRAK
jgi:uncharacterized protein YggE